jgi:hypothetical protein
MTALERAFKKFDSLAHMARQLGVTPQCVGHWKRLGGIPAKQAKVVGDMTGINWKKLLKEPK